MPDTARSIQSITLLPNLKLQTCQIWNIEILQSDLLPLIFDQTKIPSIPLNAYTAQLQHEDGDNVLIFLSWLGALISGFVKEVDCPWFGS